VFSQNGEDGVLLEILGRTGTPSRYFVEFGAGGGYQANCVLLADCFGWSGLFIEADPTQYAQLEAKYANNDGITTLNRRVSSDNIESLLDEASCPAEPDVLSVDIDGNDFWVWAAISRYRPLVVITEYNANLLLDRKLVMPRNDEHSWDGTDYFGASLGAFQRLAAEKRYALVHTDSAGVNAFFVSQERATGFPRPGTVPGHTANYGWAGQHMPRDPNRRPFYDLDGHRLVDAPRVGGDQS